MRAPSICRRNGRSPIKKRERAARAISVSVGTAAAISGFWSRSIENGRWPRVKVPSSFSVRAVSRPSRLRTMPYPALAKSPERSRLSMRSMALKWPEPPPSRTSTRSRYCGAISSSSLRLPTEAAKPAGVAWVMVAVLTRPMRAPFRFRIAAMGVISLPPGLTLMLPLSTR